jgi:hypothetical protein
MKSSQLKIEPKTEWKETELGDLELLVTGLKTVAFRKRLEKLMNDPSVAKSVKAGGKKEADARELAFNMALSETVVFGWKNLTDDEGGEIPFSSEYALQMITDSLPFRDAVVTAGQEVDRSRFVLEEDAAGNSPSTSVGG